MSECESYEVLVSAQVDGELETERYPELLDHVARCRTCRRFYLEAQALGGVLEALPGGPSTEPLPESIWQEISASQRKTARLVAGNSGWILRLAASVVLALGVAMTVLWLQPSPEPSQGLLEIALGETPEAMTDERFVEITTELLKGDRRYRQTMLQVMAEVEGPLTEGEGDVLARIEGETEDEGEVAGELRV